MSKASILLVDDDRQVLRSMTEWLEEQGHVVDTATTRNEAIAALARRAYDMVLADIRLADGDGFEVLSYCRQHCPTTAVIMITGYGTVDAAVEAIRAGAFDFLTKPLIDEELEAAIARALSQRSVADSRVPRIPSVVRSSLENIVGRDYRMLRVYDMIESVADTRATVLITGESGTGKSLIARAIHRASSRRNKPFVEVACGALPETLLESELFGHAAGSFTGANSDKVGKFMLANEGTIFLDEIATASPALQVKLLRVLQDLEFEQVGGTKTFTVDARVILATNEDLGRAVAEGRFRRDLYYRINVINIELPSLRERLLDIPLLARHFLERSLRDAGKPPREFTEQALAALEAYPWPGNVRELQNVIERAVLLGKGPVIDVEDLPPSVAGGIAAQPLLTNTRTLKQALSAPERQIILEMLETHNWNRMATAEALGINRTTLYKKMKRLGLDGPEPAPEYAGSR